MTITQFKDMVVDSTEGIAEDHDGLGRFRHRVVISIQGNGPGVSFPYLGSHADFKEGYKVLSEDDTLYAAMMLMESALAGTLEYRDYVEEYYDNDFCAASYDSWEDARRIYHDFTIMGMDMSDDKWVNYLNELREVVNG